VTFSSHVEVWYGRESDTLSSTILTHEQLGTWHDKPWTLDLDKHAAVVEPLSTEAVLIPTVCNSNYEPTCSQPRNHSADAHHAQIGDNAAHLIPDAAPRPSDFAIYDMHSSWHLHLRVEWREHATSQYGGERIMKIQTWYFTNLRMHPRS